MTVERLNEIQALVNPLLEDDTFFNAMQKAETEAEVRAVLSANGVELTAEEMEIFASVGREASAKLKEMDELDEAMLELVAGGAKKKSALRVAGGLLTATAGYGMAITGGIVFVGVPGGQAAGAFGMGAGSLLVVAGLEMAFG